MATGVTTGTTTPRTAPVRTAAPRTATPHHYLMCPPTHFEVSYAINPWMDVTRGTDTARAVAQWETLRRTYLGWGHTVDLIDPVPGLPDMVYATDGATVVDGVAHPARFRHAERAAESPAYEQWFASRGYPVRPVDAVHEGGDLLMAGDVLLAGTGFRTDAEAHRQLARRTGREVLTLELVDPRFYHLDTALGVVDPDPAAPLIAYFPPAFSPASQRLLAERFGDAILADEHDAVVLGLNMVSDGRHVVLAPDAVGLARAVRERGLEPHPVDLGELLKGGGGARCCTLEIGPA